MKILVIDYGKYIPYGSSYYESIEFSNFLKMKGEDVDILKRVIISPIDGSVDESEALIRKYDIIVSYTPFDFDFIIKYMKIAKTYPDIIFFDEFNFIKVIESTPGFFDPKRSLFKKFVKLLPYIQKYVVPSKTNEEIVHRNIANIDTIYATPYAKESYFVKSDKIFRDNFVFTGRSNPIINDVDILIKAVSYIVKNTDFLETHNLLCRVTNSDNIEVIKNKIEKMKLSEYFIFAPPIKNYPNLIASFGFAVVLPAKTLRISNILETMATGLPVLMPDDENDTKLVAFNGKVKEKIVEDGKNGLVYDHNDYKDLAEKIMLMIDADERTYREMRNYASTYASEFSSKYTYQKIYEAIKEVYSDKIKHIQNKQYSKI